jgi:malate synthase
MHGINTATAVMYFFHNPHGYPREMATDCLKRSGGVYAYVHKYQRLELVWSAYFDRWLVSQVFFRE